MKCAVDVWVGYNNYAGIFDNGVLLMCGWDIIIMQVYSIMVCC